MTTTTRKIQVGDKVRIAFDNPPDEWGVVEHFYRANGNYHRRALVRRPDGTGTIEPMNRLSILEDDGR